MKDTIELGSSPCNEDCLQVGNENYELLAKVECQRFIELIRKKLGPEPPLARLFIKWNNHDFGTYAEVCLKYETDDDDASKYAELCEIELPTTWDDDAI
jgi:hypothetical protein